MGGGGGGREQRSARGAGRAGPGRWEPGTKVTVRERSPKPPRPIRPRIERSHGHHGHARVVDAGDRDRPEVKSRWVESLARRGHQRLGDKRSGGLVTGFMATAPWSGSQIHGAG